MKKKILLLRENPPETYLKALSAVGAEADCSFFVSDYSPYRALLLIGGGDVFAPRYGKPAGEERGLNLIRDEREFAALDYFTSRRLPVLGVCRGLQVLTVYFGGTLKTLGGDGVPLHRAENGKDVCHSVRRPLSLCSVRQVNSNHRQAAERLPDDARVLLQAEDGRAECVFFPAANALGVQFHPERMTEMEAASWYGFLLGGPIPLS